MSRGIEVARGLVAVALLAGCGAGVVEKAPPDGVSRGGDRSALLTLNPSQPPPPISPAAVQAITGENPAAHCGKPDGGGSAELDGEFKFAPDGVSARLLDGCAPGVRCGIKIFMTRYPSEVGTSEFLDVFVGDAPNVAVGPGHYPVPFGLEGSAEGRRSAVAYTFVPRPQDPGGDRPLGVDHREAMSGAVDISTVSPDWITGSIDVSFGFGGTRRLKGTFCAPVVPNL